MTQSEFDQQMSRITNTFGEGRVYSRDRIAQIWKTVCDLSGYQFARIVDNFLSSFRQSPLPKDFADAARAERRTDFNRDVTGAAAAMNTPWPNGLQKFLGENYPGCKTINDAVQVQILKNQVDRAKAE